jgi:hypothetical protein
MYMPILAEYSVCCLRVCFLGLLVTLKMEALRSSETSTNIIHNELRHIVEDNNPQLGDVFVLLELLQCILSEIKFV